MARTDPVFNLRMPVDLKDKVTERSKQNGRSINSEIVAAIELALVAPGGKDNKIAEEVSEILERVKCIEKNVKNR